MKSVIFAIGLLIVGCASAKNKVPSSWLGEKITIDDIHEYYYSFCEILSKESIELDGASVPITKNCTRGAGNPFKHELVAGYKVFRYSTPEDYWRSFSGHKGFALEVNGEIVETIVTTVQ